MKYVHYALRILPKNAQSDVVKRAYKEKIDQIVAGVMEKKFPIKPQSCDAEFHATVRFDFHKLTNDGLFYHRPLNGFGVVRDMKIKGFDFDYYG